MIDYPLKKWVIDNIKCPRCGSIFTRCEANMRNPLSFATFIVYCKICERIDIIETGMFDKTLRFAPIDREVASRYEKKYLGEVYKLPGVVWLSDIFLTFIIALTGVYIAISPIMLYIYFYGRPQDHDVIFFFLTLVTLVSMFYIKYRDREIGHFASRHTIWRWVLKNIKCPECGNAFTKCDVEPKNLDLEFIVHCTYCKRDRLIELEPLDLLLVYDNYLFSWNNVPGTDSEKLLRFLRENCLNMAWVEKAEIHKSDDNKTIHISKNENSGEIMIDEGGGVTLKIGDFTSTTYLRVSSEPLPAMISGIRIPRAAEYFPER